NQAQLLCNHGDGEVFRAEPLDLDQRRMLHVVTTEERIYADPGFLVGKRNDRCFLYPRMAIESGLDFAKFDSIPPALAHAAAPPEVRVAAIRRFGNDVASPVPALLAGIDVEAVHRLLR